MSIDVDAWGVTEAHFWLRGRDATEVVEFDESTQMWTVYGHPETNRILADYQTFSSDIGTVLPEVNEIPEGLVQMDPPRHHKLRKLVSSAFTPKTIASMEPRIAALTGEFLDAAGPGRLELVNDLAYPLPVTVIAELLGVPAGDRALFKEWIDGMLGNMGTFSAAAKTAQERAEFAMVVDYADKIKDYLSGHVTDRRSHPRDDLLSRLTEARVDGERLEDDDVVIFAYLLLLAGHITTTMLLGNTMLCLDAHPEALRRVRADRSLVPSAIEESLRMFSPFATLLRVTTTDTEVAGRSIPAHRPVTLRVAAANRDRRVFGDPHDFDPARDPNPHLAFGRGIHFCMGAPLARLEGRVAVNVLLDRYPNLRTDPHDPPRFLPSVDMTTLSRLPLLT